MGLFSLALPYIAIYGSIANSDEEKCDNTVELSFSIYRKIFKEENKLQLAKLNNITINTTSNEIKNFGILSIKNKEAIGGKNNEEWFSRCCLPIQTLPTLLTQIILLLDLKQKTQAI